VGWRCEAGGLTVLPCVGISGAGAGGTRSGGVRSALVVGRGERAEPTLHWGGGRRMQRPLALTEATVLAMGSSCVCCVRGACGLRWSWLRFPGVLAWSVEIHCGRSGVWSRLLVSCQELVQGRLAATEDVTLALPRTAPRTARARIERRALDAQ
jgi:hypothetical protein